MSKGPQVIIGYIRGIIRVKLPEDRVSRVPMG